MFRRGNNYANFRRGSALLLFVLLSSASMFLAVILFKIVYNTKTVAHCLVQREQAFWQAEAGIEKGKVEIFNSPAWYTDLPHYPEDDVLWLKTASVGHREDLGNGWFKIIRERDKDRIYAVGGRGKAVVVLKAKIAFLPFKFFAWEEL